RSFGEDPGLVANMAAAHVRGIQEYGMLATAKHFPGHGDTGTDSHIELPVITVTRARTDTIELPPYRRAIDTGVAAIMTAHIAFPALTGDQVPATLNPRILTGLLRQELGFRGLVVTDAMDMGAIVKNYGNTRASVLALQAGADLLLQPLPDDVPAIIDALVKAVESGELGEARIDSSVQRLLHSKARVGLHQQHTVDLAAIPLKVATPEHLAVADSAAQRSITAVRDRDQLLPLSTERILSIVYADDVDPFAGRTFQRTLSAALPNLRTASIDRGTSLQVLDSLRASIEPGTVVLFSPFIRVSAHKAGVALPPPIAEFARSINAEHKLVVTAFGSPYVLMQLPELGSYVIAWGQWDVLQRAAARALLGQAPITGRLPIAIPPLHAVGEGLTIGVRAGVGHE
ncbi:MAG TPA: glycoside hydrolase family 3 N-terminal domain-containing protein, partial [Longimicrobiales bacterium]|nr:glycoside hydrolase family 3 N-terminal domain-containing protein [Longimicrobiales bacterium]